MAKKISEFEQIVPKLISEYLQFLLQPLNKYKSGLSLYETLTEKMPGYSTEKNITILSLISIIAHLEKVDKSINKEISNASKNIRNSLVDIFYDCKLFSDSILAVVADVSPIEKEHAFDHELITFKGLNSDKQKKSLITSESNLIEKNHVILFYQDRPQEYIDLYPFLLSCDDYSDIFLFEKTDRFKRLLYKKLGDNSLIENELDWSEPLMNKLHQAYEMVNHERIFDEFPSSPNNVITIDYFQDSFEKVWELFDNELDFIRENVTNPISKEGFISKTTLLKEQLKASIYKNPGTNINLWIDKLKQIHEDIRKSPYHKLMTFQFYKKSQYFRNDSDESVPNYVLFDKYGGRYIIPDKFYEACKNLKSKPDKETPILEKEPTDEVKVILYLAIAESFHENSKIIGVEDLMVALSKICNKLVFDWYNAIQVSPKEHRDMIRYIKNSDLKKPENTKKEILIKNRLEIVFQMATHEANLAKREKVSLVDIFSAILREGHSLPIRILHNVYGLSSDRILSEFYYLLRKL